MIKKNKYIKKDLLISAVKHERKVRHDTNTLLTGKILITVMYDKNDMTDAKLNRKDLNRC